MFAKQMHEWKLLPQAEPFTELYFTNANHAYKDGSELDRSLLFTVHNVESKTLSYIFTITAKGPNGELKEVDRGQVTLAHGAYKNIQEDITLPTFSGRTLVTVTLEYSRGSNIKKQQSIHFWTVTPAPPPPVQPEEEYDYSEENYEDYTSNYDTDVSYIDYYGEAY